MDLKNPLTGMSKTSRYVTIAGAAGIGGYMVYRHHKTTGTWNPWSAGSPAAGTTGTDPVTGMPWSQDQAIDPATGQSYLAEAQQYGSVQAAEASVSAFGQSSSTGSGIPVNAAAPQTGAGVPAQAVGSNVYTSNAAWAQAVTAGLTSVGYDGATVAAALGSYLTGTPLTPDEASLVRTAIAEYGPAPVGNLQIISQPARQPSKTAMVTVPSLVGLEEDRVGTAVSAAGLRFTGGQPGKKGSIRWVVSQTPKAGTQVTPGSVITITTQYGTAKNPYPPK